MVNKHFSYLLVYVLSVMELRVDVLELLVYGQVLKSLAFVVVSVLRLLTW